MRKKKVVNYECTWRLCKAVVPESDERVQAQINKQRLPFLKESGRVIGCPECGSPMQRKVGK